MPHNKQTHCVSVKISIMNAFINFVSWKNKHTALSIYGKTAFFSIFFFLRCIIDHYKMILQHTDKFESNFGLCVFLALPHTFRSGKIVLLYSTVSTTLCHTIERRRISNDVCQSPAFKVVMFSQGHWSGWSMTQAISRGRLSKLSRASNYLSRLAINYVVQAVSLTKPKHEQYY